MNRVDGGNGSRGRGGARAEGRPLAGAFRLIYPAVKGTDSSRGRGRARVEGRPLAGAFHPIHPAVKESEGHPQGASPPFHTAPVPTSLRQRFQKTFLCQSLVGGLGSNPLALVGISLLFLLLLSSCGFPGVVSTSQQLPVVRATPMATALPPVRFPQDEAPHRDLTEWWYYTGHMNAVTPDGKQHHYGFELVIFQALRSDFPPVYAAHYAISDVTRGEFHFDQRRVTEPDAVIPNGTSTSGMNLHVGDWLIQGVNGRDHLAAEMANYALNVTLQALKPPTLHNGNGLITYGLGGFSYYYSRTRMALTGTLNDHQQALKVTGEAWMDHQWGNFLSLGAGGWDWFSIQLNDFTEMMIYVIRDASGKPLSTYVGYIDAQGHDALLPASALRVTVLGRWISPATGANYPSGWRIEIDSPQIHSTLTLTPELKDQELIVYQSTGNTYWEGAVRINGQSAGHAMEGEGYVELTGYTAHASP